MQLAAGLNEASGLDGEWVRLILMAKEMGWKLEEIRQLLQMLRQAQDDLQTATEMAG